MDFWRRSARISRRDKIRNSVIKQNMNVQKSIINLIKEQTIKMVRLCKENDRRQIFKKSIRMGSIWKKKKRKAKNQTD